MDKVPYNEDNMTECICGECPSKIQDGMGFYCAMGKSGMSVRRRGCVCPNCPIWLESGLHKGYHCDEWVAE
jgi:aldose sugar dehydrogenase